MPLSISGHDLASVLPAVDSLLARLSALEAQVRGKGETKVIKAAPEGEEDEDDDFELFGSDDEVKLLSPVDSGISV